MKRATRAIVSGLAAFGTSTSHAVTFDETGINDLGDLFTDRTILPADTTSIIGDGDDDFFEFTGLGASAPFRFDLDGSCDAPDQSATASASSPGPISGCAAVELGPVVVDVGISSFSGTFEYGFLDGELFNVAVGGSSQQSASAPQDSTAAQDSTTAPQDSTAPQQSGTDPQSSEPQQSTSDPGTGTGSTPTSLGPVFTFYDNAGEMIISFLLPELTPTAAPFRVSGQALGNGSINGQVTWNGPYSLALQTAVPEPASATLALAAVAVAGASRRRKSGPAGGSDSDT